ncbi:DEKNAAC102739 [Brettanomyces naardenensis]|uniref:DEKNAAC102739 n=1 Tax=Brettanomyces naardenensis TaxID=13370 RepID=A0A448YL33_BRENA|nr:DEKNAAC102739 [Brettanomyces naardenensis]
MTSLETSLALDRIVIHHKASQDRFVLNSPASSNLSTFSRSSQPRTLDPASSATVTSSIERLPPSLRDDMRKMYEREAPSTATSSQLVTPASKRQSVVLRTILTDSQLNALKAISRGDSNGRPIDELDEVDDAYEEDDLRDDDKMDIIDADNSGVLLKDIDSDLGDTTDLLNNAFSNYQHALDDLQLRERVDTETVKPASGQIHSRMSSFTDAESLIRRSWQPTHVLTAYKLSPGEKKRIQLLQFPGILIIGEIDPFDPSYSIDPMNHSELSSTSVPVFPGARCCSYNECFSRPMAMSRKRTLQRTSLNFS